jgi:hypothetical protein
MQQTLSLWLLFSIFHLKDYHQILNIFFYGQL